jgi:tetratricopeptide (TPR) repeat protein
MKIKPIIKLLIFFSFFWVTNSNAQYNADSLKQIANSRVHDTTRLKAMGYLLADLPNTSKAYDYYNEKFKNTALQLIKTKNPSGIVRERAYDALAVYYNNKAYQSMQSDYLLTIKYLNKSLEYFNPKYFVTNRYKDGKGYILIGLGVMYNKIGNTSQSIDNYFEALKLFEELKNISAVSYALQSIANLHNEQKKYDEALKYYIKAYDIFYKTEELSFQDNIQKVLLFISIAKCHQELHHCDLAANYLNKGLALALKLGDKDVLSEIYFNLGQNDERCDKDIDKALSEYQKSLHNSKQPENNAKSLIAIGSVLVKQKKYSQAETNLRTGLDYSKKINHLELQKEASENLYQVYKQTKQLEKALAISEFYVRVKDSIKKEQNDNALTKKQLQYEYDAKQSQLKLQQERKLNAVKLENQRKTAAKNNLVIGLSAAVLLLLIGSYFLYRNNKQKQAIALFEKKSLSQKLLLSQMNPHFIFNSIDNIQSLIYTNQSEQAVNYLTKFSNLTRQILENSSENYITLAEELTMIDNYLVIQQLLYNNKFDFKIEVINTINTEIILLPPMLTQPFIENAIKHGLRNKEEKGFVAIRFYLQQDKLFFEITDNGAGFANKEKPGKNKSLAMKITKERLENITNTKDFEVAIENLTDSDNTVIGAKVLFEIPYIYEN